jgi:stress response protein YsnF
MIIPVFREEVVVTTRILLVEEVHVRKQVVTTNTVHQVELRREAVTAERIAAQRSGPDASPAS